jgi:drug/metabolite transporter (DMT)-like permease
MKPEPADTFDAVSRDTKRWVGAGLALLAALAFSMSILMATMANRDGVDIHTINTVRHSVTVVLLFLFLKIRRKQLKLPPRERYAGLSLGISVFMMGAGYLSATRYIPVSVAVLIFYTHPFLIAIIARFTENEPITPIRLMAITIAFIGLVFALGIQSVSGFNWYGIAFAFLAAMGAASFVSISSLAIRNADTQTVNLHCLTAATVLYVVFMLFKGDPAANIAPAGWFKLSVSSLAMTVAYVTYLIGIETIGPVKTSILMTAEPILTIILAAILLSERLSFMQLIGAGFVMAGIILITREYTKKSQ